MPVALVLVVLDIPATAGERAGRTARHYEQGGEVFASGLWRILSILWFVVTAAGGIAALGGALAGCASLL